MLYEKRESVEGKAVNEWIKLANQGFLGAQYNLGYFYMAWTQYEDYQKAFFWFRKAAMQGYSSAQVKLGDCYLGGYGVKANYRKAFHWYKKAAKQGDAWGFNGMSDCYYNGAGVKQSYEKGKYYDNIFKEIRSKNKSK